MSSHGVHLNHHLYKSYLCTNTVLWSISNNCRNIFCGIFCILLLSTALVLTITAICFCKKSSVWITHEPHCRWENHRCFYTQPSVQEPEHISPRSLQCHATCVTARSPHHIWLCVCSSVPSADLNPMPNKQMSLLQRVVPLTLNHTLTHQLRDFLRAVNTAG